MRRALVFLSLVVFTAVLAPAAAGQDTNPKPGMMDTPGVRILKGLTVPEFQEEMNFMVQALGVNCGYCHVPRNFASENNPRKETARKMLEMVKTINQQFFPDHKPEPGESVLGKVTCYTCHQGNAKPNRLPAF
jgi:photosynthetic reaction center cytochrome c subunit